MNYNCRIAKREDIINRWKYLTDIHPGNNNWVAYRNNILKNFDEGNIIVYYGFLDNEIICETTAMLNPSVVQNSDELVGKNVVYLSAFRTNKEYQGKGYFSKLFKYMLTDLKETGYIKVTLGVEPNELKNKEIYEHYGFNEYIKEGIETYPNGEKIDVEYYGKSL